MGILSPRYHACTKVIFILKGCQKDGEPKKIILDLVQKRYKLLRAFKVQAFIYRHKGLQLKLSRFQGIRSPRYNVYTMAIFILKRSQRDGEPKNRILHLMQRRNKLLRTCKVPAFIYRRIVPLIEIIQISGHPSIRYHVCTMAILILKGCQRDGEPKNIILELVQKRYKLLRACKVPVFICAVQKRILKLSRLHGILSPRNHVFTKVILISQGSQRDGEPKNLILDLVEKRYKLLRACKVPAFIYRHMGPTTEIIEISGHPISSEPLFALWQHLY